ncbi:MAG: DUF4405 domain-containing protein [Bacteroidales bacterium]|nr:DUF4405 domain-containing protein [Bacteroidales bacterium]
MINWIKEKSKINLVIDAIMFVLLMAVTGLGLLIKYVLVAGYKRNALYAVDVDLKFLGLDRHEWGDIHLWLGIILLFFLLLHIVLHWNLITCIFSRMIKTKALRYLTGLSLLIVTLILALSPLLVSPEKTPMPRRHIHKAGIVLESPKEDHTPVQEIAPANHPKTSGDERLQRHQAQPKHQHANEQPEIYGSMTLEEVASIYNIPLQVITEALNISDALPDDRIGRLRKTYGFEMQELKDIIDRTISK